MGTYFGGSGGVANENTEHNTSRGMEEHVIQHNVLIS